MAGYSAHGLTLQLRPQWDCGASVLIPLACFHRWQGSGTWLDLPVTPSGSLVAKPAWRWAPPFSPQLHLRTWTSSTPVSSECVVGTGGVTGDGHVFKELFISVDTLHSMRFPHRSDGTCWRMDNFAKKTDVPGKFSYTSECDSLSLSLSHTHTVSLITTQITHSYFFLFVCFVIVFFSCCHITCFWPPPFIRLRQQQWHDHSGCEVRWVRPGSRGEDQGGRPHRCQQTVWWVHRSPCCSLRRHVTSPQLWNDTCVKLQTQHSPHSSRVLELYLWRVIFSYFSFPYILQATILSFPLFLLDRKHQSGKCSYSPSFYQKPRAHWVLVFALFLIQRTLEKISFCSHLKTSFVYGCEAQMWRKMFCFSK